MRVLIPVAHFVSYNTARYVLSAFQDLYHSARLITQAEYYEDHPEADLFFGVDSGGPLNFPEKHRAKSVMWFIDSRRNCNPELRTPDDDTNAQTLTEGGGWVFQAQKEDWQRNVQTGVKRSTWLPLAADPHVWAPSNEVNFGFSRAGRRPIKDYDVGFGGNVWDPWRQEMLDRIRAKGWVLGQWTGEPEDLALGYNRARVGFNCSSFFNTPVAYDINMRVFEIMACGIPLVTNKLRAMEEIGIIEGLHYMGYSNADMAMTQIRLALVRGEEKRAEMGARARQLILDGHTYTHRIRHALEVLDAAGMLEIKDK